MTSAASTAASAAAATRHPPIPAHEPMGQSEAVLVVSLHSVANLFLKLDNRPSPFYCVVQCGNEEAVTAEGRDASSLEEHFMFHLQSDNPQALTILVLMVEEERDRVVGKVVVDVPTVGTANVCLRDRESLPLVRCREGEERRVRVLRERAEKASYCDGRDAGFARLHISATILVLSSVPGVVKESTETINRAKNVTQLLAKLVNDPSAVSRAHRPQLEGSEAVKELNYALFLAEQISSARAAARLGDRDTAALLPQTMHNQGNEQFQGEPKQMGRGQLWLRGLQFFLGAMSVAITSAVDEIKHPTVDFCTFFQKTSSCPIPDCDMVKGDFDYAFFILVIVAGVFVCAYTLVLGGMHLAGRNCSPFSQLVLDVLLTFITFFAALASAAMVEVSEEIEFPVAPGESFKAYFTLDSLYLTFEDCLYGNPVPMIRGGIALIFLTCFAMAVSIPVSYDLYKISRNLSLLA